MGLVIGGFAAYSLAIVPLYVGFGAEVGILAVIPVAVAGWLLGVRGALLFGLMVIPLHTLLLNFLGQTGWDVVTHKNGEALHVIVLTGGLVVGVVRNPHIRLRRQFFERVRIEAELRDTNEALRQEMAKREGTEAALRESNASLESALDELRMLQDRLLLEERMRALGRMASGVAHDLNNTLTPIIVYADLLLEEPEALESAEAVRKLEGIRTAAGHAAGTVRRLADFYRPVESLAYMEVVQMSQLVRDALDLTRATWQSQAEASGIAIAVETDVDDDGVVRGASTELRQVIVNLILNGIDALPEGGTIVVESQHEDDSVVLVVRDNGVGMSEVVRQRCMEPFFTTSTRTGRGLGLAVAFGTVRRHGGTMDVESEEGQGTRITLRLPHADAAPVFESPSAGGTLPSPKRILVVEDDTAVLEVLVDLLRRDGHTTVAAATGQDGIRRFSPGAFDVVLVDRGLPDMSGDHVALSIKNRAADLPVVLVTGFGDIMEATAERPPGVDLVVGKPFTLRALREAIAQVTA